MDVKDTTAKAKGLVGEFREFISRGNVVDMAVGIIVGSAFTAIVNSLVKDVITPFIAWIFLMVKVINRFRRKKEAAPPPAPEPPKPSPELEVLMEIRDLLDRSEKA